MTQWMVRGSLRRVLAGGCDAVGGERQFRRVLEGGCDAVGGERQFKEGLDGRM